MLESALDTPITSVIFLRKKISVIIGTFQINLKLTRFLFQSYYISHILSIFTYEEDKENQ